MTPLQPRDDPEVGRGEGDLVRVSGGPCPPEALLQEGARGVEIVARARESTQVDERPCDPVLVVQSPVDDQRLRAPDARLRPVVLRRAQLAQLRQGPRAQDRVGRVLRAVQQRGQPRAPLRNRTARGPEGRQCGGDAQAPLGRRGIVARTDPRSGAGPPAGCRAPRSSRSSHGVLLRPAAAPARPARPAPGSQSRVPARAPRPPRRSRQPLRGVLRGPSPAAGSASPPPLLVRQRPATCRPGRPAGPSTSSAARRRRRRRPPRPPRASSRRRRPPAAGAAPAPARRAGRGSSRSSPAASAGAAARSGSPRGQQPEAVVRAGPAICSTAAARCTRAAASSIASGMPSSRRQIWATAAAFCVGQREARRGRPRPLDEEPHGRRYAARRAGGGERRPGRGRPGRARARSTSPATPSGSRLVARTRSPGQARSSASARRAQASTRCSQLSSTSSSRSPAAGASTSVVDRRPAGRLAQRRARPRPPAAPAPGRPAAPARRARRRPGTRRAGRAATLQRQAGLADSRRRRSASAGGSPRAAAATSASSRSRPTKLVR